MKIEDHERLAEAEGRAACERNGYTDYKRFANGRDACINRFLFTYAILSDLTLWGYGDRWCFQSYARARAALADWDGEEGTEPWGWHRHPATGRRRENGDPATEYVAF